MNKKELEQFKNFEIEINFFIDFFNDLSTLFFLNGKVNSFITEKKVYFLDNTLIDSACQTLRSIRLCCSIGSFSDSYTLIRKFRDDLIQFTFILSIVNARNSFKEESIKDFDFSSYENVVKSINKIEFNNIFDENEIAIMGWFSNNLLNLPWKIRKKLEFENYMNVLKENENIKAILQDYKLQDYWADLRVKLNNYVHSNGISFLQENVNKFNRVNLQNYFANIT